MQCRVVKINKKKIVSKSPEGLNTVALLRTASLALGISPKKMHGCSRKTLYCWIYNLSPHRVNKISEINGIFEDCGQIQG